MENVNSFELLLGEEENNFYRIVGTTYSNKMIPESNQVMIRASFLAIQKAKQLLGEGKKIIVPKNTENPEIVPDDIIIKEDSELNTVKNILINKISSLMHQTIIGVSVIDAMDYLDCYMKLINAGIFITDKNREDKYFEIIEKAQSVEEPEELGEDASFEDEQKYLEEKADYDEAQDNLETLEKYLNAYDKLNKIKFTNKILQETKTRIIEADSKDAIEKIFNTYKDNLKLFEENPE